jgi:hypothetical protein
VANALNNESDARDYDEDQSRSRKDVLAVPARIVAPLQSKKTGGADAGTQRKKLMEKSSLS